MAEGDPAPARPVPAGLLSLLFHALLILTALWWLREPPRGFVDEPERQVGVALAHQVDSATEYLDRDQAQRRSAEGTNPEILDEVLPSAEEIATDLSSLLPSGDSGPPVGVSPGLPSATAAGSDRAAGLGAAGRVSTAVFGAKAQGSKFLYVFDRSGSMEGFGGRPLLAAKRELIRSLADLQDTSQFQIIFYNERPEVFRPGPGEPKLVWGNQAGKERAETFVRGIRANGGTRHLEALRLALGMSPDVVFFLTDADEPQLTNEELQRLRRWNRSAIIHSIEFGFGPQQRKQNFLTQLARQNGGQHIYVDVSRLPGN